jgi:hypothetical protein
MMIKAQRGARQGKRNSPKWLTQPDPQIASLSDLKRLTRVKAEPMSGFGVSEGSGGSNLDLST